MPSRFGVRARAAALVVFVVGAFSLIEMPQALAVTSHKPLNDTRAVGSAPVTVDFPIEYFGLAADLSTKSSHLPDQGRAPYGEARFRVDGHWTAWRAVGEDGAQAPGQFTGALISVDHADAYQVRGLPSGAHNWRAAAINTTDGPTFVVGHRRADAATGAPTCMSRADWGADESISGWTKNGDTQSFAPAQVMTVHHTAGSNDPNQDYAATVRAIYSYHVQSNGWSDIGYQYLIDGHGTVYEGRNSGHTSKSCLYGGDGSDFAHDLTTDEVVTGAHVSSYNTGNIGISLMGCYEPGSSACTGNTTPPDTQVDGLEAELALLAKRHDLDPEGSVHYVNSVNGVTKDVSTISGHRDYNSTTECPGGTLYSELPAIRSNVASRVAGTAPMDSAVVSFSGTSRAVKENAGTVRLSVTRTGNTDVAASVGYARTSGSATPGTDFTLPPGTLDFAAGETTKTIPLSVTDDAVREGPETIAVSLRNPGVGTVIASPSSTRVTIGPSDQRSDGWISTSSSSGYVGNNIYNATGYQQTKRLSADRTQSRTFYVRVYNDGNVKSTFALTGSAAHSGSTVRYFSGTTDISTAMRSGTGWNVTLDPGAYKLVKVRIKVLSTASYDSLKPATVTGTWSGDGVRADTVKAVVKVAH